MSGRLRTITVAVAVLIVLAGCAPSNEISIGLKDYATNVVYGDPSASSTTLPPPPVPEAALTPGFPGFIVPAPPPPPVVAASGTTTTLPAPVIQILSEKCPLADPKKPPVPAPARVEGAPSAGAYTYRQEGASKVGGGKPVVLPEIGVRTIKDVNVSGGLPSWNVEITEFGITTTTTYGLRRTPGSASTDGLYITRVVQSAPGRPPEEFSPVGQGLRIFPEPASPGAQWRSVASDVIHGTSMTLDGTVRDIRKLDVCGVNVLGWAVDVSIGVRRPLDPAGTDDLTTTATFLVATAAGGLFLADSVKQTGTDNGVTIDRSTSSTLIDLVPR